MDNTNICDRAEDLIGFLYGELSETEARRVERHVRECAACGVEYKAFGQIHTSIVEWRNESLGMHSSAFADQPMLDQAAAQARVNTRPSAIAALREFLALSPLWMKGAAAFAAMLFCICAVLAVAYLKGRPAAPYLVKEDSKNIYSQEELDNQVKQAVARVRVEIEAAEKQRQDAIATDQNPHRKSVSNLPTLRNIVSNPRRPFTRQERQELAADLRLVNSRDDDDLDLTTDSNRPTP